MEANRSPTGSITEVITENSLRNEEPLRVELAFDTQDASSSSRRVAFDEAWVDNENLDKRKSKCCCIFTKQRLFDESSSEDDDECPDHCHGKKSWHKKKVDKKNGQQKDEKPEEHNCVNPQS